MEKWLILFCCYLGNAEEPDGKIIITRDTVEAFGVKWEVLPTKGTFLAEGNNIIRKARLHVQSNGVQAYLDVDEEKIMFSIPGYEVATLKQLRHKDINIYE